MRKLAVKTKRKTMHLPPQTFEKISTLSQELERPMVDVIDEMADATLRALDRARPVAAG